VERGRLAPLALGALGIVFGDIGTSPLYAFSQCFTSRFPASPQNVLGILSLIIWALIVVVCIKYVTFMMRADYDGEGGILALLAQVADKPKTPGMPVALTGIALVALFGAAALYGDGLITPAISVVSAIEGLNVWTSSAQPYIMPASIAVLFLLFLFQSRGTGRIGSIFGPVMLVWFVSIGIAGLVSLVQHPIVLSAFNPLYGIEYFFRNGLTSLVIFGAVVLCVTGAEALYADLGHFGRTPIVTAWYVSAFPALLLNYLGQGAHTLAAPQSVASSFYALFPQQLVIPMVVLSTAATIIASQSLITGVFSLTHQASQLGLSPSFREIHTSQEEAGQIFIPAVNVALAIGCIAIVATFRTSAALGGAYGLAVSLTMLATTISYANLTRTRFKWPLLYRIPVIGLFLAWDVPFVLGNLSKLFEGAWLPLLIGCVLFILSITWDRGRSKLLSVIRGNSIPIDDIVSKTEGAPADGTVSVFFTTEENSVPAALQNWWIRNRLTSSTIVLVKFVNSSRPYVPLEQKVQIEETQHLVRIRASFGFMETPTLDEVVKGVKLRREVPMNALFYYMISPEFDRDTSPDKIPAWQRMLFIWMSHNVPSRVESWNIPPDRAIEFGVRVPL
jgi:KUP system potassium uptake protein